jgi:hypothetical protein
MTPILKAAVVQKPGMAGLLLKLGAHPLVCDKDGATVLHLLSTGTGTDTLYTLRSVNYRDNLFTEVLGNICDGILNGTYRNPASILMVTMALMMSGNHASASGCR